MRSRRSFSKFASISRTTYLIVGDWEDAARSRRTSSFKSSATGRRSRTWRVRAGRHAHGDSKSGPVPPPRHAPSRAQTADRADARRRAQPHRARRASCVAHVAAPAAGHGSRCCTTSRTDPSPRSRDSFLVARSQSERTFHARRAWPTDWERTSPMSLDERVRVGLRRSADTGHLDEDEVFDQDPDHVQSATAASSVHTCFVRRRL